VKNFMEIPMRLKPGRWGAAVGAAVMVRGKEWGSDTLARARAVTPHEAKAG
jgi:hypothetical protein